MNQFPRCRRHTICLACSGPKDVGLVLCWPCHRQQKRDHDGGYSLHVQSTLARFEGASHDWKSPSVDLALANAHLDGFPPNPVGWQTAERYEGVYGHPVQLPSVCTWANMPDGELEAQHAAWLATSPPRPPFKYRSRP